jgi:ankyrin repeat protein
VELFMRTILGTVLLLALTSPIAGLSSQSAQDELWDAAIVGDTAAIRAAVSDGANLGMVDDRTSRNGRLALNWAAFNNHADAVSLLLELGAPIDAINYSGYTALHHSAENGSLEAARVLLKAGAKRSIANANGFLPLETAIERGHPKVAELLSSPVDKVPDDQPVDHS